MSYKTSLELAYHMGYEDALARKMPDVDKVAVLLPDVADGAGEYVYGTDGHEGHWLTGEEIVRCRDCEHAQVLHPLNPITGVPAGIEDWRCDHFWNADELPEVEPDGFCKWGRRREDA